MRSLAAFLSVLAVAGVVASPAQARFNQVFGPLKAVIQQELGGPFAIGLCENDGARIGIGDVLALGTGAPQAR
ncbi:hypothetical protein [Prosthecomicrobium sp. N25]|uniref:hypothetical protein n=1 Tax=Prosthecomicrobium sp. N25 TaxID=3129254 RepID=UPI003077E2CA